MYSGHYIPSPPKKNKTENTFFSRVHGTFFRTDHTIDYNTSFIKFQKIENIKHHFQSQHYETKHQLQGGKKEQTCGG